MTEVKIMTLSDMVLNVYRRNIYKDCIINGEGKREIKFLYHETVK